MSTSEIQFVCERNSRCFMREDQKNSRFVIWRSLLNLNHWKNYIMYINIIINNNLLETSSFFVFDAFLGHLRL